MSLIYAYKINKNVRILSDTKVCVNPNQQLQLELALAREEYNNIIKYGMIKTIIYRYNITISSAGHLEVFNECLKTLEKRSVNDIQDILNTILAIHKFYHNNTDFIITTDVSIF